MKLRARWRRFWHCLLGTVKLQDHRMVTITKGFKTYYVGCSCGRTWYANRKAFRDLHNAINEP